MAQYRTTTVANVKNQDQEMEMARYQEKRSLTLDKYYIYLRSSRRPINEMPSPARTLCIVRCAHGMMLSAKNEE